MFDKPLVSVITPSYNQGEFIEDTILSVKYQNYPYVEHIIVDGASTDNTLQILQKYKNCIKWMSEPDKGFADAVNKGIRISSGDIIAIQNADDTYHSPDSILKAVQAFKKNPSAGVIFGDSATIDENGRIMKPGERAHRGYSYTALLCSEFVIPQASAFISRSALEAIGGSLDINVDWCADFDLWVRIGLRFPIVYIPEVLADYRIHSEHRNADPAYAKRNPTHRRLVLNKIFSLTELPTEIRALKNRAYAGTYLNQASRLVKFGCVRGTLYSIATAIRLYPSYLADLQFYKKAAFLIKTLSGEQLKMLKKLKKCTSKKEQVEIEPIRYNKWWKQYKCKI